MIIQNGNLKRKEVATLMEGFGEEIFHAVLWEVA
jgi:hypothetical protein